MFLKELKLTNFKNCESADLLFSEKINCFVGLNGAGKTNLLDAVYCLSMAKSFFNFQDSFSIRDGKESAALAGYYPMDDGSVSKIGLAVYGGSREGKVLKCNDKAYKRPLDIVKPKVFTLPQHRCFPS